MPCKKENASKYVVTHEYGHMLENVLIKQDKKLSQKTFNEYCIQYKNEIENIARSIDMNYDINKCMTKRGIKNEREFFAECFANSQLGDPNVLGQAMTKWLERRGYNVSG